MNFQIILFTLGFLLVVLGSALVFPLLIDTIDGHQNAQAFGWSALSALFLGLGLCISNKNFSKDLNVKHAFFLTVASWVVICLFCSIPLYVSDLNLSFTDAAFESISGVTTTGATILSGLDDMSRGIHLWRAITQWIGGIGIVAFAMILLPFLRIGGMQLFKSESSDQSEKIMPKTNDVVLSIVYVYLFFTVACALTYWFLGMSGFDALIHALTTIPTGGFSNHDASFGYFDSYALHMACTVFMFLGGIPFILFVKLAYQGRADFWRDAQVRIYSYLCVGIIGALTLYLTLTNQFILAESFKVAAFNVIAIMTGTGYATLDYSLLGTFSVIIFLFISYLGGCAGSTTGGLKMMRITVAFQALGGHLKTLIYPHGKFALMYQGKTLNNDVIHAVMGFLFLYVFCNVVLTIAVALTGLDFITSLTGAASAIANVGPGLGDTIGPAGNYAAINTPAKWLLCFGMLLGRLEILTVLVLFMPSFWRD